MTYRRISLLSLLILVTFNVFAIPPILATLNESFPNPVYVKGDSHRITYTFTNQLPFTLVNPLFIEKTAIPENEFSYEDNCTDKLLKPNETCTVDVILSPKLVGAKQVELIIERDDRNTVPLPLITTMAVAGSGVKITGEQVDPPVWPASIVVNNFNQFKFRFTNNGITDATGVDVTSTNPDFHNNCPNTLLAGESCDVSGEFNPTSIIPSPQTVSATLSFAQGDPVVVSTAPIAVTNNGLSALVTKPLPAIIAKNTSYPVEFMFTNHSVNDVHHVVVMTIHSPHGISNPTFVPTAPCASPLPKNGGTCIFKGNFVTGSDIGYSRLKAELEPIGTASSVTAKTTTKIQASTAVVRKISFDNKCNFPVWFSLSGGAAKPNIPCTVDSQCPIGFNCNVAANNCFSANNYSPIDSNTGLASANGFKLDASGGAIPKARLEIPIPSDKAGGTDIVWSGTASASTGCVGSSCSTAGCGATGGSLACPPGVGFKQPATQAEFTLQNNIDTYDVEVINGFHIPISISPDAPVAVDNYSCGTPGNGVSAQQFGACNWSGAVAPNVIYNRVTSGGGACTADLNCSGDELCGLSQAGNTLTRVCGKFLGYWTANQACSLKSSSQVVNDVFDCQSNLGTPFPLNKLTMNDLYGCKKQTVGTVDYLDTCYGVDADEKCCGCQNWNEVGVGIPAPPVTEACVSANTSEWKERVQPTLLWIKKACPTTYTYPFDDKSSTFTCAKGVTNTQGYTITFCSGNNGLPSGLSAATDGRAG